MAGGAVNWYSSGEQSGRFLKVKLPRSFNPEIPVPGLIVNTCIYVKWHIYGYSLNVIYNSKRLEAFPHFINRD